MRNLQCYLYLASRSQGQPKLSLVNSDGVLGVKLPAGITVLRGVVRQDLHQLLLILRIVYIKNVDFIPFFEKWGPHTGGTLYATW